jgi:hypothetical protein
MDLSMDNLQQSVEEWRVHRLVEPADSFRRVRQVAFLLYLVEPEIEFMPMRILLSHIDGIALAQQGGRSLKMEAQFPTLEAVGLTCITETSPAFAEVFDTYLDYCVSRGKPPANYSGVYPMTGRVFWTFPHQNI